MIYNKKLEKLEKKYLYQFIPKKYEYLLKTDIIIYKEKKIKTSYLINIIHEILIKYYFNKNDIIEKDLKFNMWSLLLREKYGNKYNYYINYLIETEFIKLVSDYYKNQKSRTYVLNYKNLYNVTKCKVYDKVLIKKHSQDYLKKTFLNYNNSPIPIDIRQKIVDNLFNVKLDIDKSLIYLNDLKKNNNIDYLKYQKNLISIDNLSIDNLFFKFDDYGRVHTNFTVLKKDIRKNFITINNLPTYEMDIKNSQPLFLTLILKEKLPLSQLIKPDVSNYINLVKNGLIYEEIMRKCNFNNREDAKILMYRVLFGKNDIKTKENLYFNDLFPTVYKFITDYKLSHKDYRVLSHELQLKESDFIFNKIIRHFINIYPDMVFFTVHDSIVIPINYKDECQKIFDYYLRNLLLF